MLSCISNPLIQSVSLNEWDCKWWEWSSIGRFRTFLGRKRSPGPISVGPGWFIPGLAAFSFPDLLLPLLFNLHRCPDM
jgi:hypothetical protein